MDLKKLVFAISAITCTTALQAADLSDSISIRSFGTIGVVHSSTD